MLPVEEINLQLLILVGTISFLLIGISLLVIIINFTRQKYKHQKEKQILQSQFTQTLLQSQLEIKEQTLNNISHELHDNFGQVASLIKIHLNTINVNDPAKTATKIADTKELVLQLITDLKTLSISLSGDRIAQIGLAKALETEVARLNKSEQFSVLYTGPDQNVPIDSNKAIIVYRMAQEILNNIVKHSKAQNIILTLRVIENLLILQVTDNGVGFLVDEKKQAGGAGLHNLENRALLIHATLRIDSNPGNGTRVTIELPL